MLFLVVAVLGTAAFAERGVYEITETDNDLAGFYVQIDEHSKTFQQFGGPDDKGYFTFLYNLPNNPEVWHVGFGKHVERIIGFYSASGGNDGPSVENWKSNKGEVQVFKVRMSPSLFSTLMQTEANKGSATVDGRVGCPNYPKIRPRGSN